MKLFIKNMVCDRCRTAVESLLEKQKLHALKVELGEVEIKETLTKDQSVDLQIALQQLGFELMDDKRSRQIEKIKNTIIALVRKDEHNKSVNLSAHIAAELKQEYNYLSHLFSEVEGITIEKYFIRQKVERAKELLVYDEHTVSHIADLLGYSSVAHLSNQFKQVTGFTPSQFRHLRDKRVPLDKV